MYQMAHCLTRLRGQGANRLPQPSGHAAAVGCSDEARVGLREVGSAAAATLTTFLDLQQALAVQHPGASTSEVCHPCSLCSPQVLPEHWQLHAIVQQKSGGKVEACIAADGVNLRV